ncbi:MAG: GAF domain-containing protein, partial [Magnetococcales bacterium]|nr:GAF domain-containing protein [Magnetococcales bacterium]
MLDLFRGMFGGCQSPTRFLLGLTLIGLGETGLTVLLTGTQPGFLLSDEGIIAHFASMTAWNLAIILIFFHLPLYRELINRHWIHTTHLALSNSMRDVGTLQALGELTLLFLTEHLKALNGVIYLFGEDKRLHWLTGIGTPAERELAKTLDPGEGMLGQVAITRRSVRLGDLPVEPLRIQAGVVELWPRDMIITPLIHDEQLQGVIALGSRTAFKERHIRFLERASETIARAIAGVSANVARQKLLEESRLKSQELAINQQVLRGTIQLLEQTSGFKSRFLANMSHELRSPLNSLLILAQLLQENKPGNLTPKQVEYATTIHAAGSDLLTLIDEILDLARIEAGRIRLYKDPVKLTDLATSLDRLFSHVAQQKKLEFEVLLKGPLPINIRTDRMRVEQILKNLITNAIKFTHMGRVTVTFRVITGVPLDRLAISVADTGVGIPRDLYYLVQDVDDEFNELFR